MTTASPSRSAAHAAGVQPLVAGNWKMNGVSANLAEVQALDRAIAQRGVGGPDVIICPPATLIAAFAGALRGGRVAIGGQDCHPKPSGAHTGDIAAEMLRDAGATSVIVGHSERRTDHGETNALVRAKAEAALRAGLTAIVCIGETADERKSGATLAVVTGQLEASLPKGATAGDVVIAYEPVWAIGTGLTPTPSDVADVHAALRQALERRLPADGHHVRILYGGSVKPSNAQELLSVANVNGALVGGASLTARDLLAIISAYDAMQ